MAFEAEEDLSAFLDRYALEEGFVWHRARSRRVKLPKRKAAAAAAAIASSSSSSAGEASLEGKKFICNYRCHFWREPIWRQGLTAKQIRDAKTTGSTGSLAKEPRYTKTGKQVG